MINEFDILAQLKIYCKLHFLPEPADGREFLPTNPHGKKFKKRKIEDIKGFVFHQALGGGTVESSANYHITPSPQNHLNKDGVESISYTWAIRDNGQILLCNDFEKATWSQGTTKRKGDENSEFMSCLIQGNFNYDDKTNLNEPSYFQLQSAMILWWVISKEYKWQPQDLYGHYHFGKPACPGNTIKLLIESIRHTGMIYNFSLIADRQAALKKLGYYPYKVDGIWGDKSKKALEDFHREQNIINEKWSEETEDAIRRIIYPS